MKKYLFLLLLPAVLIVALFFGDSIKNKTAFGDSIGTLSQWVYNQGSNLLYPRSSTTAVQIPSLGGSGTKCLHTDNSGNLGTATADCGSGSGSFSTTTINGLSTTNYTFSAGSGIGISTSAPGTITILNTAAGGGATTTIQAGAGGTVVSGPTFIFGTTTVGSGLLTITGSGSNINFNLDTSSLQPAGSYITNSYASSTFVTYPYASSTFPSFNYASSTFPTYTYASSGYATLWNLKPGTNVSISTTSGVTINGSSDSYIRGLFSASNPITYNNGTGAIGWTNSNNYITLGSLSGTDPITYNNGTGAIGFNGNGYVSNSYASSTFPSFGYGTSTYSTYGYGTSTYATIANYPTYNYASSAYATVWNLKPGANITITTSTPGTVTIAASGSSGITSVSAMTGPALHVATSSDTNITISVSTSTANTLTFIPGWTGQLAVSRGGTGTNTLASLTVGSNLSITGGQNVLLGTGTQISLGANVITSVATGTAGNIFNISTSSNSLTLNLPFASGSITGQLQAADWTTFNNKLGSYNVISANGLITVSTTTNLATLTASTSPTFTTLNVTGTSTLATMTVTQLTVSNLTSGNCVEAGTGGILQSAAGACGTGGSGNSAWTIGNGLIYNATSTDLVGIGTITPTTTLFVQGKAGTNILTVASSSGATIFSVNADGMVHYNALVSVVHADGSISQYNATTTTDIARGQALVSAMSAATTGDSIYLSANTFDIGTNNIDQSLGGTGSINVYGSGKYATVVQSQATSTKAIFQIGNNTVTADLSIIANAPGSSVFQYPWGSYTSRFNNALLQNVYISGGSDGIYFGFTPTSTTATVINATVDSKWDSVTNFGQGNILNIYNSIFTSTATTSLNASDEARGMVTYNNAIINSYNNQVIVSGGVTDNRAYNAYLACGSTINIYGGTINSSGPGAYDLNNNDICSGLINITANTIYHIASTTGSIGYADKTQIMKSISSNFIAGSNITISTSTAGYMTISSSGGSGITSLSALTGPAVHVATTSDTNITVSISTTTANTLTFIPGWTGTLADGRIASAATWNAKLDPSYASSTFVNYPYASSTFPSLTYASSSYVTLWNLKATSPITISTTSGTTIACATCVTNVTASGVLSSSGGTTPAITFTGILGVANGGTGANNLTSSDILFGNGTNPVATSSNFTFTSASNTLNVTGTTTISNFLAIGTTTPLVARFTLQNAAGTTDAIRIASSTGATMSIFDYQGHLNIGTTTDAASLAVQGASGQTSNLFNLASSSGLSVLSVKPCATGPCNLLVVNSSSTNNLFVVDDKGNAFINHIVGSSTLPTIATSTGVGTGAGTSATMESGSTDLAGLMHFKTTNAPATNSTIVTITFARTYAAAPFCDLTPGNSTSTVDSAKYYASTTASTLLLKSSVTTAITATTTYDIFYSCNGKLGG